MEDVLAEAGTLDADAALARARRAGPRDGGEPLDIAAAEAEFERLLQG
jgi:hypothetical protein